MHKRKPKRALAFLLATAVILLGACQAPSDTAAAKPASSEATRTFSSKSVSSQPAVSSDVTTSSVAPSASVSSAPQPLPATASVASVAAAEPPDDGEIALVYNTTQQRTLYERNASTPCAPASLAKLLTAIVALEHTDADTVFRVGSEQRLVHAGSSLCLIKQGHALTLKQLLCGLLMASGNDAAYTIAANVGRLLRPSASSDAQAVSAFVDEMNRTAQALGMRDSHFTTPDGWDDATQITTANDLLVLTMAALDKPWIRDTVKTQSQYAVFASGQNMTWTNSNILLDPKSPYYRADCTGVKTGTTDRAGDCLISSFSGADNIIIIVLHCTSANRRYTLTCELADRYCR